MPRAVASESWSPAASASAAGLALHEANVAHGVARLVYHVLCEHTQHAAEYKRAPSPLQQL